LYENSAKVDTNTPLSKNDKNKLIAPILFFKKKFNFFIFKIKFKKNFYFLKQNILLLYQL
jgi:hypothetical protein